MTRRSSHWTFEPLGSKRTFAPWKWQSASSIWSTSGGWNLNSTPEAKPNSWIWFVEFLAGFCRIGPTADGKFQATILDLIHFEGTKRFFSPKEMLGSAPSPAIGRLTSFLTASPTPYQVPDIVLSLLGAPELPSGRDVRECSVQLLIPETN